MAYSPPGMKQIDWFGNVTDLWANPRPMLPQQGGYDTPGMYAPMMVKQPYQMHPGVDDRAANWQAAWDDFDRRHAVGQSTGGFSRSGGYQSLPAYQDGTDYHPGGQAVVGENGPEVVDLPQGSRVHPNRGRRGGRRGDRLNGRSPQSVYDEGVMAGQLNAATGVRTDPSGRYRTGSAGRQTPYTTGSVRPAPTVDFGGLPDKPPMGSNPTGYMPDKPAGTAPIYSDPQQTGEGPRWMNLTQFLASMDQTKWYALQTGRIALMDDQGNVIPGTSQYTVPYRNDYADRYGRDPVDGTQTLAAQQQDFNQQQQIINRFGYRGAETPMNYERNRANANARATLYDPQAQADYETGRDYILHNSPYASMIERGEDPGSYTDPQTAAILRTQALRRANGLPY